MPYNYILKLGKKAQALIISYVIVSVFMVISAALLSKAVNEKNNSYRSRLNAEAFYLAEGATENAIFNFISAIANYEIIPDVANFSVRTTFNTFGGATVDSTITRLEDADRLISEGAINIFVRNYEIVSTAVHPRNNNITITLHQIIARRLIPTFQHGVFYAEDLEILPGANMYLSGRIHSNKDIYLDAESAKTLTIDSLSLHSAGNIYNQRKDSSAELSGDVSIRVDKPGAPQYEKMNGLDSESQNWSTEAINRWQGTVQSAVHGVTKLAVPAVGSIQPDGYYTSQAGVVIIDGVLTKNGVELKEGIDYPVGTVTTNTSFYNNREGKDIDMTDIDIQKLAGYAPGDPLGSPSFPSNLPANGLIYATRSDTGVFYQPGIRLKNASEIDSSRGLTLVSDAPVYIQGDFNKTNKKPVSIIGDAVNILSNNWDDSKDRLSVNSRVATETTVNCAFIASVDETKAGNYNGGLENYPRLHEKWSNVALNIRGSFVALWNCSIAKGSWKYGEPQYMAPIRNWDYDSNFNNMANLPPFTPWAVEAQRVAWWKE